MSAPARAAAAAVAVAAAILVAPAAMPGGIAAQGAGSGASTVLRIPPGPRPLALGNALTAVDDVWAAEYNPAGARLPGPAVAAAFQSLPVGASAGAVVFALPVRRAGAFSLSMRFVDYGEIDVVEPDATLPVGHPTGETAHGGEVTTLVSGAVAVGPVRLGLAGRWLRVDVAGLIDDVFAADAGASLALAPWLRLAGAVQNVGGELEAGRPAPLPRTVRMGAALRHAAGPVDGLLALEARRREARTGVGAGLELTGRTGGIEAAARVGYESRAAAGDAYSRFVFGGGITADRLSVDLAYRALGPLGSTRQVGVGYRF
jgi:hypothetical protein